MLFPLQQIRKFGGKSMLWKIVLVLGILGLLLGLAVAGVSAALPIVTDGKVDWDEGPIFGLIGGGLLLFISFLMFFIGLIFVLKNRKKASKL
jgi:uncharacterized BrkB/YihY/UPF0761 family membrane protein